ncbi:MAG: hypothetical protein FWE47_02360 [Oscillospiraceae bacterium]|nr:hypothetical protein [Oscillospiraceae bacterium]
MRKLYLAAAPLLFLGGSIFSSCTQDSSNYIGAESHRKEAAAKIMPDSATTNAGASFLSVVQSYLGKEGKTGPADRILFREACDAIAESKDISAEDLHMLAQIEIHYLQASVLKNSKVGINTMKMLKNEGMIVAEAMAHALDLKASEIEFSDLREIADSDVPFVELKAKRMMIQGKYKKESISKSDSIPPLTF